MADLRIPFDVAVSEPRLLQPFFDTLSFPQRTQLKIAYGCELDDRERDEHGFTELDYYWISQGYADYDELGYPARVTARPWVYQPREYREAWGIWGVRAGKSDRFACPALVYEAVCGGHEAALRAGKRAICFQIAQDLRLAKYAMHGLLATLESIPFLKAGTATSKIQGVTADRIDLWNGITIACVPPTVKSVRGFDSPAAVLDEVGVWYQMSDSANPDFAVYNQVTSRQAQFDFPKVFGISSPWNKGGILHQRFEAGTDGRKIRCEFCRTTERNGEGCPTCEALRRPHQNRLILHGTTAGLGNPLIKPSFLQEEYNKDPKAFEREYLARFLDSLSGFLSPTLLEEAVERGVLERPPKDGNFYVAALDPAFRRDAFGFCVGHADERGIVVDVLRKWDADPRQPHNPQEILRWLAPIIHQYHITVVYTDQHHFDSLNQLALEHGFALEAVPFTATRKNNIWGNFQQLLNQRRLLLLDEPDTLAELKSIERKLAPGGTVQIAAPDGMHDDMATVVALMAFKAVWLLPAAEPLIEKEPTLHERCVAQIARRNRTEDLTWD